MDDDTTQPFGFPVIGRKKVVAASDGGRLTSDSGALLLAGATRMPTTSTPCAGIPASSWPAAVRRRDAGHRRHRGRGAWAPAAVAVQRPLRRALLPADPCLRHRDLPTGDGAAA